MKQWEGYVDSNLDWDGKDIRWGGWVVPMYEGGLDEAPGEVKEVRLLDQDHPGARWMDGALITLSPDTATPVQQFTGIRRYVEAPRLGHSIYVGINGEGESLTLDLNTTYSLRSRRREGSLNYEPGWTLCCVNVGEDDAQNVQLCLPRFKQDGTVTELRENEPVTAPMFWGLYHLLTSRHWSR